MSVEDLDRVTGRPGWTVDGDQATAGGAKALVRNLQRPGHTYRWWHVAIVDQRGRATYVMWVAGLSEAIREAEHRVR